MIRLLLLILTIGTVVAQRTPFYVNGVAIPNPNLTNNASVTFTVNGSNIQLSASDTSANWVASGTTNSTLAGEARTHNLVATNEVSVGDLITFNPWGDGTDPLVIVDSDQALVLPDKFMSFRVQGDEKLAVNSDGSLSVGDPANTLVSGALISAPIVASTGPITAGTYASLSGQTNRLTIAGGELLLDGSPIAGEAIWTNDNGTISAESTVADGGNAFIMDTANVMATSGNLFSVKNSGTNAFVVRTAADLGYNATSLTFTDTGWVNQNVYVNPGGIGVGGNSSSVSIGWDDTIANASDIEIIAGPTSVYLEMLWGINYDSVMLLSPAAGASVTPYVLDTALTHTSGNLLTLKNATTNQFLVDYLGALSLSGQTNRLTVDTGVLLLDGSPIGGSTSTTINTTNTYNYHGKLTIYTNVYVTNNSTIFIDGIDVRKKEIGLACSDETTALSAGAAKVTFRMPYKMSVTGVRASLTTAQTSGSIFTVNIEEGGASILSTAITIDNGAKTSTTATTPPVISDSTLADDAEITVDIDQIGDGTATGLKVWIIGNEVP